MSAMMVDSPSPGYINVYPTKRCCVNTYKKDRDTKFEKFLYFYDFHSASAGTQTDIETCARLQEPGRLNKHSVRFSSLVNY